MSRTKRSRICIGMAILLIFAMMPMQQATASTVTIQSPVLVIDNAHLYGDMQHSYSNGYMPTVQDNKAKLLLPLVSTQQITGNAVQVTVDLGDAQSAPFVFQNIHKTILLQEHAVDQGAAIVQAYLIELEIELLEDRRNGRYPVTIQVSGATAAGVFTQNFPLFVTIIDGKSEEQPVVAETKPQPQPKLMITEYVVEPSPVEAGETFHASITLKNTSESQAINNLKVTVSGETTDIIPTDGMGTFYFKQVKRQKSVTLELDMQVLHAAEQRPQKLTLDMSYEGKDAQAYMATESVVVQIQQPMRVEIDAVTIPSEVYVGETLTLPINVMNMGRADIYNVRAELQVEGLLAEASVFMGNVDSGSSKQDNLYAFVQGKLGVEQKYGDVSGKLILTYEDEFAEVYTQEFALETTIHAPVIVSAQGEEQAQQEEKVKSDWRLAALIGGILVAGVATTIFIVAKVKRNKREEDEID